MSIVDYVNKMCPRRKAQGKRRGRGRWRVQRFLQPCLLLLLRGEDAYGYALHAMLEEFGFDLERFDPTLVYRALKGLEEAGWVNSHWEEASQGPKRRVYKLTAEGSRQLDHWMMAIKQTQSDIERLLARYYAGSTNVEG
ncbi:MAG: PadR family transcriptional regulator [Anaerolineales bacterium]|nr:PadR family transcriptional regulator [Anaerolineales bacterium]